MSKRFEGKVAIVTGCGAEGGAGWGNGKAVAALFAREGAKVFGCDNRLNAAEETRDVIRKEGGQCEVMKVDVANGKEVEALIKACIEKFGRIDALVNNVGVAGEGGPVECTEEQWQRDMDVNIKSMFLTCKYTIPHMERQGGGSIVNFSSVSGIRGLKIDSMTYQTSKAAVLGFSRSVAIRYADKKIRSNVIIPGFINTPIFAAATAASGKAALLARQPPLGLGEAWDIAEAVAFLCSDAAKYVTGIEFPVDGGISAKYAISNELFETA